MSRSKRDQQLRTSKQVYQSVDYFNDGPLLQAISVEQGGVPYVTRYGNKRHAESVMKRKKRKVERLKSNRELNESVREELDIYPESTEPQNINTFSF